MKTSVVSVSDRSEMAGMGVAVSFSADEDWREDSLWGKELDLCRATSSGRETVE